MRVIPAAAMRTVCRENRARTARAAPNARTTRSVRSGVLAIMGAFAGRTSTRATRSALHPNKQIPDKSLLAFESPGVCDEQMRGAVDVFGAGSAAEAQTDRAERVGGGDPHGEQDGRGVLGA